MRTAVIVFPGSNCDRDMAVALKDATGRPPAMVWHKDTALPEGLDLVALPGGFSFGDYLRCGAIAARSPVMRAVVRFAEGGGLVLGVCNGWQVLQEAGLLPGALMRNRSLKFVCRDVTLRVETTASPFTRASGNRRVIAMPSPPTRTRSGRWRTATGSPFAIATPPATPWTAPTRTGRMPASPASCRGTAACSG